MAADDLAFFGLEQVGDGRWSFELVPALSRLDMRLYGGTGLAVSVAAMEAETARGALWTTVQFVGSVPTGERIDCHVEVLAPGRRASQVRVTGTWRDEVVFCALGATADRKPGAADAGFATFPDVASPDASAGYRLRTPFPLPDEPAGWMLVTELREARWRDGQRRPDRLLLWTRLHDRPLTRAGMGFLADMVPMGVARALGRAGGGTSIDNTIRFGPEPTGDWLLVDLDPHLASGGYGQGAARLWAEDGTLLGIASQTAKLLLFD